VQLLSFFDRVTSVMRFSANLKVSLTCKPFADRTPHSIMVVGY
jgi:hypothetical protein